MARRTKPAYSPKAEAPPSPQQRQNGVSRLTNVRHNSQFYSDVFAVPNQQSPKRRFCFWYENTAQGDLPPQAPVLPPIGRCHSCDQERVDLTEDVARRTVSYTDSSNSLFDPTSSFGMGASQSYSVSHNTSRRIRDGRKADGLSSPVFAKKDAETGGVRTQTSSPKSLASSMAYSSSDGEDDMPTSASRSGQREIKDYTEPLDAKKFVWGKTESVPRDADSGNEDTFYSKPYEHTDVSPQMRNLHKISGKSAAVSNYDIPPSKDHDYNHLTCGGSTSSVASLIKQSGAAGGSTGEARDSDGHVHSSLWSLSHHTVSSSSSGSGSLPAENIHQSTYQEPWDLKKQRDVARHARGLRLSTSSRSEELSSHALYEEAWDSPQQQQRLEENLRLARTLSVTSDKFEDALEYQPEPREPSPIRTKPGSKKVQDPVTGGTYEQAWDLNRGLEEKLRSLQLNRLGKECGDSETDNYQEPWDTAKKQRELEEKLQKASGGSLDKLHSKDHRAAADSQKENWLCSQTMSGSQSGETTDGSPSSRRTQSSTCSIGEPINAMIPLVNQSWYHGNISRDDAERILRVCKEGSYLVRDSSDRYHYTLCIKSSRQTINIQIDQCFNTHGITVYILGKNSKAFETVPSMIDYYTHHPVPIKGAEHTTLLHPVHCQWSEADAEVWG